jgi:peptidoglycan/LPS O-acetylase OafA/YrhL
MSGPLPTRSNNFDALRLAAAFFVLISHQYALWGLPQPVVFGDMGLGTWGVLIFFSISGFLVSQSWRQDPHIGRFLAKRFLRIWPGLAAFTLIAAFILGPTTSTLPWQSYFSAPEFLEFFNNLKLISIRHYLPGVFENNPFPKAVNGSLWTIPLEVRCYITLALVGVIGLTRRPVIVAVGTAAFGIYYFVFAPDPTNYLFHFGLYFFAGVCLDLFRKIWDGRGVPIGGVIAVLAAALLWLDAPRPAFLLLITYSSVWIGSRATPVLNQIGRFGDVSYGVYVYAFGVQQTVMWVVGRTFPFAAGLLIAAGITTLCAYLSWYLVERPALALKLRLRAAPANQAA